MIPFADMPSEALSIAIGLIGGLCMFLYGMKKMSDGLKRAAGDGMKKLLSKLTSNRFMAATTGAVVTAVIQSSSVTTVLVVGFVTAGIMSLSQSVGVIMGANIGTTITGQIAAFKVTEYAWLMIAFGFGLGIIARHGSWRHYGAMLLGLGMLFLGMEQMGNATYPLRSYEPFIQIMAQMDNPFLGILVGALFTALVQSSSATTGIVITLASAGFLTLEGGISLALGANVGTCFTAVIAAIGKPTAAVRAAAVHVIFNVIGALLWVGVIGYLADVAKYLSPVMPDLTGVDRLAAETPRQIANANTIFNVANTCILIWFATPIAKLACRLVPERPPPADSRIRPEYLDPIYLKTPSLALDRVRMEVGHLGEIVVEMLTQAHVVISGTAEDLDHLVEQQKNVDGLHLEMLNYLRSIDKGELSNKETVAMEQLSAAGVYLSGIADSLGTNLVAQGRRRLLEGVAFSAATSIELQELYDQVKQAMVVALNAFCHEDAELALELQTRRETISKQADETMENLFGRLFAAGPDRAILFSIEAELVVQAKQVLKRAQRLASLVETSQSGDGEPAPADEEG